MKNLFYLNKDLQPVKYKSDAIAIVHYFKDETSRILYKLGDNKFKKIIEITFFEPIGYNLNQPESYDAIKKWQKKIIQIIMPSYLQKPFTICAQQTKNLITAGQEIPEMMVLQDIAIIQ